MDKNQEKDQDLVKNFGDKGFAFSPKMIAILLVLVVVGIGGGYVLSSRGTSGVSGIPDNKITSASQVKTGTILGSNDTATFNDTAEGTVQNGGIDGDGQYHLVRPGGASQYVYLTSSTLDLSLVLNKKIKVWGQTLAAQHAGWLMDVGRVQVE